MDGLILNVVSPLTSVVLRLQKDGAEGILVTPTRSKNPTNLASESILGIISPDSYTVGLVVVLFSSTTS